MEAKRDEQRLKLSVPDGCLPKLCAAKICGAKTRSGSPCLRAPDLNGRCNLHGGKSLAGIASKRFKHGRYSKYLPTRQLERGGVTVESVNLSQRAEIALMDARICDLLSRVETGESGKTWLALAAASERFQKATAKRDASRYKNARQRWEFEREEAIQEIMMLCTEGGTDYDSWADVRSWMDGKRRFCESESKYQAWAYQNMSLEHFLLLMEAVMQTVAKHVTDPDALQAFSREMSRILGRSD